MFLRSLRNYPTDRYEIWYSISALKHFGLINFWPVLVECKPYLHGTQTESLQFSQNFSAKKINFSGIQNVYPSKISYLLCKTLFQCVVYLMN
jgi:hypothetical protein